MLRLHCEAGHGHLLVDFHQVDLVIVDQQGMELRDNLAAHQQVLVPGYAPAATIGWHKDPSAFGNVVGISLLSSCTFRLSRRSAKGFTPPRPVPHRMGA